MELKYNRTSGDIEDNEDEFIFGGKHGRFPSEGGP
jgi:hypothetical protein